MTNQDAAIGTHGERRWLPASHSDHSAREIPLVFRGTGGHNKGTGSRTSFSRRRPNSCEFGYRSCSARGTYQEMPVPRPSREMKDMRSLLLAAGLVGFSASSASALEIKNIRNCYAPP